MIKPRGKWVLIEPAKNDKEEGKVLVPERWQVRPKEGVVLAVGSGVTITVKGVATQVLPKLKVGDKIMYSVECCINGALPVQDKDDWYWLMHEDDILGVVEEGKNG